MGSSSAVYEHGDSPQMQAFRSFRAGFSLRSRCTYSVKEESAGTQTTRTLCSIPRCVKALARFRLWLAAKCSALAPVEPFSRKKPTIPQQPTFNRFLLPTEAGGHSGSMSEFAAKVNVLLAVSSHSCLRPSRPFSFRLFKIRPCAILLPAVIQSKPTNH